MMISSSFCTVMVSVLTAPSFVAFSVEAFHLIPPLFIHNKVCLHYNEPQRQPLIRFAEGEDNKRNKQLISGDRFNKIIDELDVPKVTYMDRTPCLSLEEKIENIRKACTPVLGTKIEHYEWEVDPNDPSEENGLICFYCSNQMVLVVELVETLQFVETHLARIGLLTGAVVDELFPKERRDSYTQHRIRNDEDSGFFEILGVTIKGVYLVEDEKSVGTWTRLFFDAGKDGLIDVDGQEPWLMRGGTKKDLYGRVITVL